MNFYRIKPRWRVAGKLRTPPATEAVRVPQGSGIGNKDTYLLDWEWVEYFRSVNSRTGWNFISIPHAGVFNRTEDDDWYVKHIIPKIDTVAFDGNIVNVIDISRHRAMIETIDVNDKVPLFTFENAPWLVHKFTAVNNAGKLSKAGRGLDVYCPLLTREPSCLPMDLLEPFPTLPAVVTVSLWTVPWLNVRVEPNTRTAAIGRLHPGSRIEIFEYRPIGLSVWAKTLTGWICLRLNNRSFTNWAMKPILPV